MAVRKYVGEEAIERVSQYVNRKLTVVAAMPASPSEADVRLYIGPTTEDFIQGGIYLYLEGEWHLISQADVDLSDYETSWTGTQDDYWAMTEEERAQYEIVNFTDDFVPGTDDHVVSGYYYEGKFYEDDEHTIEIAGLEGFVYIDLPNDALYLYDTADDEFVLAGGSGGSSNIVQGYYYEGGFYEDSSHTTLIFPDADNIYVDLEGNTVYRYDATETEYVAIGGGGSSYTAGFGISIENDEIKTTDFVGTQAQWDALTDVQKAAYDFVHITDDTSPENYSPGHAISDGTTEKTQREVLEFEGFTVTDDSVNGKTKVAEVPYTAGDGVEITEKEISVSDEISRTLTCTTAEWNAIVDKSVYDGWIINITDDQASGVGVVVDTVEDGNMNAVTSNAVAEALSTIITSDQIPLSGQTSGTTGSLVYFKLGKLVNVTGNVSSTQNVTTVNGQWAGLPTPITQFDAPTESGTGKIVQLRADGGLRNYATVNGTSHFNFTYFTAD